MSLGIEGTAAATLDEIARRVFTSQPGLRFKVDLEEAAKSLGQLSGALPGDSAAGRELHTLRRHLEPISARRAWIDNLAGDWRLLRSRLSEIRNQVTHGEGPRARVADSVLSMGSFIARQATLEAAEAFGGDSVFRQRCEALRVESERWRNAVSTIDDLASTLGC